MSDYKKSETRQILEEIYSGKHPVRGSDGREYYVRYNDGKEELEEVSPPELRPLTKEDEAVALGLASGLRPQGIGALEIAGEGLKGFGQGVVSGLGRVSGGATLGATDWLDRKTGGHLASLDADLQRSAESAGLGGWNKAAKFASELGGNIQGAGGALVKGLSKAGLKGLKLASASGGLEGMAYGATGSDSLDELPKNVAWGAAFGAALPVGLHGVGRGARYVAKPFSSRLMTAGMTGGLGNVSGSPEAVKLLKQGIKNNDDVAEAYLSRVRPELRGTNSATAETVDNSLASRINVPETIAAERARYGDYMAAHGADEVMDFAPTREQLLNYPAESRFNPNKKYTPEKADKVLRERAERQGLSIYNDDLSYAPNAAGERLGVNHFLSGDRRPFIRTLNNTMDTPDLKFTQGDKDYFVKKYTNSETGRDFYDLAFKKGNSLFNKFPKDKPNGIVNQIKNNPTENMSFSGRVSQATGRGTYPLTSETSNNIPYRSVVVNPELPHVSSLYEGLTPWQMGQLDKALKTGLSKTNMKAGSLESLNKVKQEINEMISKVQSTDKPSEVWQLQELKGKFDNAMPQGLKEVDAGFARAKRLEDAFDKGTHYNPNNVTGADTIAAMAPDEQNAFAQGLFKRINNNSLTDKSLADEALKYENTLAQVLPGDVYNRLIQGLNRQSTKFGRLSELGRVAENRLKTPEGTRFFGREQLESKGSMIGSGLDWINNLLRGRAIRRAALDLMNPNFVGRPLNNGWVVDNPLLSAGLSSAAFNNLRNR